MLRRPLAVAAALMLTVCAARAATHTCGPVNADAFIAAGMSDIASGAMRADALTGARAEAFGERAEFGAPTLAVFVFPHGADFFVVLVVRPLDGPTTACLEMADDADRAAIRLFIGDPA